MNYRPMSASMTTVGASADVSSRGYSDQVAKHYQVKQNMSSQLEERCEQLGASRVRKLIRWVNTTDPDTEVLLQEKDNFRIYEVQDDAQQLLIMKGVVVLQNSSCDEIMELLSGKCTTEVRAFLMDIFPLEYADSACLHYVGVDPSKHPERSSTSSSSASASASMLFQWLALKDVNQPQAPLRDYFFMRFNQAFHVEDPSAGHRISYGASIWESVEIPTCRQNVTNTQMTRTPFKNCGYIVESSIETDATRVTYYVTMPFNRATVMQDRSWLLRLAGSVRFIPSALVNLRIRENKLIDKGKWDETKGCKLCSTAFTMFRRPHHCRMCGAGVCSKCSSLRKEVKGKSSLGTRVCLSCLNGDDKTSTWASSMKRDVGSSSRDSIVSSKDFWSSRSGSELEKSRNSFSASYSSSQHTYASSIGDYDVDTSMAMASLSLSKPMGDEDDVTTNSSFHYELTYKKGNAWPDAPIPSTEAQRLKRIQSLNLSQQYAKANYKELLDLARTSINCPVAAVSVITVSTSLLVTAVGLAGDQLPRDMALEAHSIMSSDPLVILDTQEDERFAKNPLVSSLHIRFYIALPLVTHEGTVVGALCLGDTSPREKVNGTDLRSLKRIASRIVDKMDANNLDSSSGGHQTGATLL